MSCASHLIRMVPFIQTVLLTGTLTAATPDIDRAVLKAMDDHHVPGVVVVVVLGGRTVHLKAYGIADLERSVPMTVESVIGLQSTSKLLTGMVALHLAARGTVDLTADIRPLIQPLRIGELSGRPITLADLLTHSAGLGERSMSVSARTAAERLPLQEFLRSYPPPRIWPAGSIASYSNHGFALAAFALQSLTHTSFADLADETLIRPLGLGDTTFTQPLTGPAAVRRVSGYMWRGRFVRVPEIIANDWPASGASTSARDMAAILRLLLDSGNGVALAALTPRFRQHPVMPGVTVGGLVEQRRGGQVILRHGGDWQDFANVVALVPDRQLGIFIAGNNGEQERFGDTVLDAVLAAFDLGVAATPSAPRSESFGAEADITGTYRSTRHDHAGLSKVGLLTGRIPEVTIRRQNGEVTINTLPAVPDGDLTFRRSDGERWAIRPATADTPQFVFRERAPTAAFERVAWLRSVAVQRVVLGGAIALLVLRLAWAIWRRRWAIADIAIAIHVIFVTGIVGILIAIDPWEFQYGLPLAIRVWLILPWLALVVTLAALFKRRAYATGALSLAFLILVHEWNLWVFWR